MPGDRERMIEKAFGLSVDAVMMDLEDGVAAAEKDTARRQIAASLDQVAARLNEDASAHTPSRYVRINAVGHERMREDLASVVRPGLEGLVVPKVETPEQVKTVERVLDVREPELKMPANTVRTARRHRKSQGAV